MPPARQEEDMLIRQIRQGKITLVPTLAEYYNRKKQPLNAKWLEQWWEMFIMSPADDWLEWSNYLLRDRENWKKPAFEDLMGATNLPRLFHVVVYESDTVASLARRGDYDTVHPHILSGNIPVKTKGTKKIIALRLSVTCRRDCDSFLRSFIRLNNHELTFAEPADLLAMNDPCGFHYNDDLTPLCYCETNHWLNSWPVMTLTGSSYRGRFTEVEYHSSAEPLSGEFRILLRKA